MAFKKCAMIRTAQRLGHIGVRPNRCALFEKMSFISRQIPLHIFLCAKREEMCGGHLNIFF